MYRQVIFIVLVVCIQPGNCQAQAISQENVKLLIEEKLEHPHRVAVPKELPFSAVVDLRNRKGIAKKARVFPCIEFQEGHFWGWQACLSKVALIGFPKPDKDWKETINSLVPPVSGSNRPPISRGFQAGFFSCQKRVRSLVERGETLDEIQRLCSIAHGPILKLEGAPEIAPITPGANQQNNIQTKKRF